MGAYIKINKVGAKRDPCGTPQERGPVEEVKLAILTEKDWLVK